MKDNRGIDFSAKKALEDATEKCKNDPKNVELRASYERDFKQAALLKQTEAP